MMDDESAAVEPLSQRRRASDRRRLDRRTRSRRSSDRFAIADWEQQRAQYVTRYLFAVLGLAYFNLGESVVRGSEYLLAINLVHVGYIALTTFFFWHARRRPTSHARMRLAMLTDLLGVSAAVFVDANIMAPAFLVYVVIILGNGMRYGLHAFGEAAAGSFVAAILVLGLRLDDYLRNFSMASFFFLLFLGIIVLYAYALMGNIERARRKLEAASAMDVLTGLLNRRGLHERAETLFKSLAPGKSSVAVLFADLDGFKAVNDAHGHAAGDQLLKEIGRTIAASVRGNDVVARFGGDEFVVIMPDATLDDAAVVAKRLQQVVATADAKTELSVTIGMALAPEHGADLEAVLKTVDAAMYEGKLVGGRGVIRRADGVAVA